jgi:hypothetical protein
VVVLGHGDSEPALQLLQGQAGSFVDVVAAALADIGEGRAGQTVHQAHQRANHPLDHAAELRLARRAPVNGDAMLLAAALECGGMEIGAVVHANPPWLALHRPVRFHLTQREPGGSGKILVDQAARSPLTSDFSRPSNTAARTMAIR